MQDWDATLWLRLHVHSHGGRPGLATVGFGQG